MNPLIAILVMLGSLSFAGAYPFLIRNRRVLKYLEERLPHFAKRSRQRTGFAAVRPNGDSSLAAEDELRRIIVEAVGLVGIVAGSFYFLGNSNGIPGYLPTPVAALIGLAGGLLLRKLWSMTERLSEIETCAERLRLSGIDGSWHGGKDETLPFGRELLNAAQNSQVVDVLAPIGLVALEILSHPARAAFEAPHPALAGKRIRLLLLPPRSQKVDPQRRMRSCAEEALSRAGSTPEKHWRGLQQALEIQRRWNQEYGSRIEVRFLEGRPVHSMILAGPKGWFRPWYGDRSHWFEVAARGSGTDFRTSLDDAFEGAWQDGSEQLSVFQRKDGSTAVMSTGSSALRKEAIA